MEKSVLAGILLDFGVTTHQLTSFYKISFSYKFLC